MAPNHTEQTQLVSAIWWSSQTIQLPSLIRFWIYSYYFLYFVIIKAPVRSRPCYRTCLINNSHRHLLEGFSLTTHHPDGGEGSSSVPLSQAGLEVSLPRTPEKGLQRARHQIWLISSHVASEQGRCFLNTGWKIRDVFPRQVGVDAQRSRHHGTAASAAALPAVRAWLPWGLFFEFPFKDICPLILPRGQQQPAYHLFDWHTILPWLQREPRPSSQSMVGPELCYIAETLRAAIRSSMGHHLLLTPSLPTAESSSFGAAPWAPPSRTPWPHFFSTNAAFACILGAAGFMLLCFLFFSSPGEIYCCKAPWAHWQGKTITQHFQSWKSVIVIYMCTTFQHSLVGWVSSCQFDTVVLMHPVQCTLQMGAVSGLPRFKITL